MNNRCGEGPDLYIIVAGRGPICIYRCGRGPFGGLFFVLEGPPTVRMTPHSVESHLESSKIEGVKILKREPLFSEKIKPEIHFFVSKSFAIYSMVEGVRFCVRNCHFWTKRDCYFHFLTLFDTFWTS